MKKLSCAIPVLILCSGMALANQILTQQAKNNIVKNMSTKKLAAAQEECFVMKIMNYCPELVLFDAPKDKEKNKERKAPSRGEKAEAVADITTRPKKEENQQQADPEVKAALECRMLSLMECGVDVEQFQIPVLPRGDLREKAVTR
ncbi:MAG: hypothetical protein LBF28_02215 [Rickettsiales bacterium]|jgi:hypothetical protein|nr:hypothetical protein [Rickettsiales bacterium]